jgi:hypothetical protein
MHIGSSGPSLWYFLPPESKDVDLSHGLGLVTIVILAFFTVGLLIAGFVDGNAARSGKSSRTKSSISSPVRFAH